MAEHFEHKKSLGQHFLNSDFVPQKMAAAAKLTKQDTVLEIGPGTGALTKVLLEEAEQVIALEADERAIAVLGDTFKDAVADKRLIIYHTDARMLDLEAIPEIKNQPYKVVANIPYYLSGHLFRCFLETEQQPTDLVFLVQKEVAERICRDPKESILSLSVKVYGDPHYVATVKRGHFTPPPAVDSAIVAIHDISKDHFHDQADEQAFFALLHLGLGKKRKQLLGNLTAQYSREALIDSFSTIGISETVRGEDLSLAAWLQLHQVLAAHN